MNTPEFLKKQHNLINGTLHLLLEPLSDEQWLGRPLPGGNLVAFTAWHLVRVLDAQVHTVYRGLPELQSLEPWSSIPALAQPGVGIGLTLEEADAIGRSLSKQDLLAYADAIRAAAGAWLDGLEEADLDVMPDLEGNRAKGPEVYRTGPYLEFWPLGPPLNQRPDKPLWLLVSAGMLLHSYQHMGEIEIAAQAVERAAGGARRAGGLALI